MPITLPPIPSLPPTSRVSRRRFLAGSLAAGAGLLLRRPLFGADEAPQSAPVDPHRFALLSDTHIAADPALSARGVNMFDHMKQVCGEVLKLDKRPAAVLVDGDCAYNTGKLEDYATFVRLLKPLREAGLPIHLALGNHDDREHFWQAIPDARPPRGGGKEPVEDRQVLLLESPRANWFVLDSLDKTNSTPGVVGEKQLAWLGKALDARAAKPAIVMVHHNPDEKEKPSGLVDTKALLDVIQPRKQVKVLFFGHTHDWHLEKRDGLHWVNFPAVAYVFTAGKPSGWVDAHLGENGMSLELRCVDPGHPQHGEKHELEWRG